MTLSEAPRHRCHGRSSALRGTGPPDRFVASPMESPPEADRLPLVRRMAPDRRGDELAGRRGPTDARARRGRGGDRYRRRVRARPSLGTPAVGAVPAPRRDRRSDQPDRDRHRRHRHAVREPALHGGGRRRRGSARRWSSATGISRGSPEPAWRGPKRSATRVDADDVREKTAIFRAAISGEGVVPADAGGRPATSARRSSRSPPGSLEGSGGARVPGSPPHGSASKACT